MNDIDRMSREIDILMAGMMVFLFWIYVPLYVTGWTALKIKGWIDRQTA